MIKLEFQPQTPESASPRIRNNRLRIKITQRGKTIVCLSIPDHPTSSRGPHLRRSNSRGMPRCQVMPQGKGHFGDSRSSIESAHSRKTGEGFRGEQIEVKVAPSSAPGVGRTWPAEKSNYR